MGGGGLFFHALVEGCPKPEASLKRKVVTTKNPKSGKSGKNNFLLNGNKVYFMTTRFFISRATKEREK